VQCGGESLTCGAEVLRHGAVILKGHKPATNDEGETSCLNVAAKQKGRGSQNNSNKKQKTARNSQFIHTKRVRIHKAEVCSLSQKG